MANCVMSIFLQLVVVWIPSCGYVSARIATRAVRRTGREILLACGMVVGGRGGALDDAAMRPPGKRVTQNEAALLGTEKWSLWRLG